MTDKSPHQVSRAASAPGFHFCRTRQLTRRPSECLGCVACDVGITHWRVVVVNAKITHWRVVLTRRARVPRSRSFDVAVRMKQRRGLLTEPSQPQARSSRRRCDPDLRRSLTAEHGPVEDFLTVAHRSSLHESAGFLALVAARPPKVAVGFNPRRAMTQAFFVAERQWKARVIGANEIGRRSRREDSIVAPRREGLA